MPVDLTKLIDRAITDVCELPDRSSPDDWPEAMLVTGEELAAILTEFAAPLLAEIERKDKALTFVFDQLDFLINHHYGGELPCTPEELEQFEEARAALSPATPEDADDAKHS